jgi:hypothetical protein
MNVFEQPASEAWAALLRVANKAKACVVDEQRVSLYLSKFPDTAPVASDLLRATRTEFPQAEISLELYCDPEIDDQYLKVCVRLASYTRDFRKRLRSISATFDEERNTISGYVSLTSDYIPASEHAI